MKTAWTKGLTVEQQEEIIANFKASAVIRDRLTVLLEEKASSSKTQSRSKDEYANPNWAYLQADARGYERALFEAMSLLEP